ncbi:MAG: NUDIX hydrolase [Bacteroidota bacterium]
MGKLKLLRSEKLYAGKVFNLLVDHVEYPSGNHGVREVADHPGGAVALPLMKDGTTLLVRQFRYPMKQYLYELPAGKLNPGEDPKDCAARELEEETGYVAGKMEKLTSIYTTPGFCNEMLHLYLATDLRKSERGQQLEEGELSLTVESVPFEKVIAMIESGEIIDSKTICAVLLAERRLKKRDS